VVTPGWVDPHTHPVWAGSRVDEFELRVAGADYVRIAEAGGGIMSTVLATRRATSAELLQSTTARVNRLVEHGATTIEVKTGYGLTTADEMRQLEVLVDVSARSEARLVITFLGAHAVPDEFRGRPDEYVDLVVYEMLPRVAALGAEFADVFCDAGAFTVAQTRRILEGAADMGLGLKVHSDEFENLGCTAMAAELGAVSADHLVATRPAELDALARAGTVAVLLPGTTFGLGSKVFAPARDMVARGVPVALGSDLNPGTCPSPNLALVAAMACRYLRLSPAEAIVALTRNAAFACGRGALAGQIRAGYPADIVVLHVDDYRDVAYEFGENPVAAVMIGGRWVRSGTDWSAA
jgi:imidazolonepropionase